MVEKMKMVCAIQNSNGKWWTGKNWSYFVDDAKMYARLDDLPETLPGPFMELHLHTREYHADGGDIDSLMYKVKGDGNDKPMVRVRRFFKKIEQEG